jgi:uridine phosphorylase
MTPDYVDTVLRLGTIGAVALIVVFGSTLVALAMLF